MPSVDRLAVSVVDSSAVEFSSAVRAARAELDMARSMALSGESPVPTEAELIVSTVRRARQSSQPNLRRVINATGVALHTNLGRAPLSEDALKAILEIARGYSNLEYNLEEGTRGRRMSHVEDLLRELSGAEAAFAVNNNAAAVTLALAAHCAGREVIVSRGELVEIGGSFRVPEILEQSGAKLIEVGTTNRTRISDYEKAITPETAAILKVHQSNFRTVGFTEETKLDELSDLVRGSRVRLIQDLGSGALSPIEAEPTVQDSIRTGTDLLCCSADKLMGGPQAGLILGRKELVDLCAKHPLARMVRLDKLQLAALEATARTYVEKGPASIPVIAMLTAEEDELRKRATAISDAIGPEAEVTPGSSLVGGGSLPLAELTGPVCAIDPGSKGCDQLMGELRRHSPPIIARISEGRVIFDPRTMLGDDAEIVGIAAAEILREK